MDIEKKLLPENGRLITKDDAATAKILDAELDPLECVFNYDSCVEIKTEGYSYITLTIQNLNTLKRLIKEAERYYDNHDFDE